MRYPLRNIVAGIADIDADDFVLRQAVGFATPHHSRLHLIHAFELPAIAWDVFGAVAFSEAAQSSVVAETLESRLAEAAARAGKGLTIECEAVARPAAAAIHDAAENVEADLVVVGATHHGPVGRVLLGTTAQRVLRGSRSPVYIARQSRHVGRLRILLTTDLTDFSAAVHEHALDVIETLLEGRDLEVRSLLGVAHPSSLPLPLTLGDLEEVADRRLTEFLQARRERDGVRIEPMVRFGRPAEAIRDVARDWQPDLVVVGTHSRDVLERWVFGSVAEAVTRDVEGNVLVIPAAAAAARQLPVAQSAQVQGTPGLSG